MLDEIGPKTVTVEDVAYDYTRFLAEILDCLTCGSRFMTHVVTGIGVFLVPDDKTEADACPGCLEMLRSQDVMEPVYGKPS